LPDEDGRTGAGATWAPGWGSALARDGHYTKMRIDSYGYNLGVATVTYQ
jgi:hypothetical protein